MRGLCGSSPLCALHTLPSIAVLLLFLWHAEAQPTLKWKRQAEAGGAQQWIDIDVDQNIYVATYWTGALNGVAQIGDADVALQKYDKGGTRLWTKLRGGTGKDEVWGLTLDPHKNIYVGGTHDSPTLDSNARASGSSGDIFVMKWTEDGSHIYTNTHYGGNPAKGYAMTVTQWTPSWATVTGEAGMVYIAGDTTATLDSQTFFGGTCAFLMKFNGETGAWLWTRIRGSTAGDEEVKAVAVDNAGAVYITGRTNGAFDSENNDGSTGRGGQSVVLVKYLVNGDFVRTRIRGSTGNDVGLAMRIDANDNVYVAGNTNAAFDSQTLTGTTDVVLIKWDSAGDWGTNGWTKQTGTASQEYEVRGMTLDTSVNIFVVGGVKVSSQWNSFLMMFDSAGVLQWTDNMGASDSINDKWNTVAIDTSSRYGYAAGYTEDTFESLTKVGTTDLILAKWQVTTVAATAGTDPVARYGDRVTKFNLKVGETTALLGTPELMVSGSVFEGGGPWEQWFDRIVLETPARDRFLRIQIRRNLHETNNSGLAASDFQTLEVALGWGKEGAPGAVLTQIPGPKVPIPFSFLGHEVAFEKIRRVGQKFPSIGRHLRECAEVAGPSVRFHVCSSPASEYYGPRRHLSMKYAHLDLIVKDIHEVSDLSGLLPELWGIRAMSDQTRACLADEEGSAVLAEGVVDAELANETAIQVSI